MDPDLAMQRLREEAEAFRRILKPKSIDPVRPKQKRSADVILTTAELAERLRVNRTMPRKWEQRYSDFPGRVTGPNPRVNYYSWRAVEAWYEKHLGRREQTGGDGK